MFLDSSALVKRYLTESSSEWVAALAGPSTGNTITVAELTRVEVAAAIAARHRATKGRVSPSMPSSAFPRRKK